MKYTLIIHTMLISTSVGMFIQAALCVQHTSVVYIHWLRSHGTLVLSYTLHTYRTCIALCPFSFFFVTPTAKQGLDIGTTGESKSTYALQAWYSEGQCRILLTILCPTTMFDYTSMGTNPAIIGCCSKLSLLKNNLIN